MVPLANNTSGSLRLFTLRSALGEDGYRVGKEYDKNLVTIGIEARVVKEQMKNAGCTNALGIY